MDQLERPDEEHIYPRADLPFFEKIWGKGFISPGGPEEVSKILTDVDLAGKRVLDIGCGMGGVDQILVEKYGVKEVVGIDVEAPVLEKARTYIAEAGLSDRVTFIQVEPGKIDIEDSAFDVVFSKDALLHIQDKDTLFSEIYRLLNSDGFFVGSDWLRGEYDEPSDAMKKYDALTYGEFHMVTSDFYKSMLCKAQFNDVSFVDRNGWYLKEAKAELQTIRSLKDEIIRSVGEEIYHNSWEDFWLALVGVLTSGELRPTHFYARKK